MGLACCPRCECWEPIELDSWIGGRSIDLDLTSYPGWQNRLLYDERALIWAIVVKSSGNMVAETEFRMQQGYYVGEPNPHRPSVYLFGPHVAPVSFDYVRNASEWDAEGINWLPIQVGTIHEGRIQRAWGDAKQWLVGDTLDDLSETTILRRKILAYSGDPFTPDEQGQVFCYVDATCPSSLELVCIDGGGLTSQWEYALVVICVPDCDDPTDDWWPNFEQRAGSIYDRNVTFDLRMNDTQHLDQEYCRDGVVVSAEGRCTPHVAVTSWIDIFNSANEGYGMPLVQVARLKEIYGIERCHFLNPLTHSADSGGMILGVDWLHQWVVLDRITTLWLSGLGGNSGGTYPATMNAWSVTIAFLAKIQSWLDQGDRVLVIDGHYLPADFYVELGLGTTIGAERTATAVNAVAHPFTVGCSGNLVTSANYVRELTLGPDAVMIGEGVDGTGTYPVIACEEWSGNPTSRIIIWSSYSDLPTAIYDWTINDPPFPRDEADRLSKVGIELFLQNLDTQRLVP